MARKTYEGACVLCKETVPRHKMLIHLIACLPKAKIPSYIIYAVGTERPEYWLYVEIPSSAKLADLDKFLRSTWLECCGHLSAFTIRDQEYSSYTEGSDAKSMNYTLEKILKHGDEFNYEYDFGTTTPLTLKVVAPQRTNSKNARLLAMNLPPRHECSKCASPSSFFCQECEEWFCKKCAKHGCDECMLSHEVNSPRVGQCAY